MDEYFKRMNTNLPFPAGLDAAEMAERGRAMLDNLVDYFHFFHQIKSDVE